jgi:hypothetical protein
VVPRGERIDATLSGCVQAAGVMGTPLLAILLAVAPHAAACPAGAAPRVAIPCYPDPVMYDDEIADKLPPDRIYILLDDAAEEDEPVASDDGEDPKPVAGRPFSMSSEDLVPRTAKAVVGRRRTVRVGDAWVVLVEGRRYDVVIESFARYEGDVDGVRTFDETWAIARMPKALLRMVGPCGYDERYWDLPRQFLAAPSAPPSAQVAVGGVLPDVDAKTWRASFAAKLDEQYRDQMDSARIARHEMTQCGETRILAVLSLDMAGRVATDYPAPAFSEVRVYGPRGTILFESGLMLGATDVQIGDINGDGSDEALACQFHWRWSCQILRARDGAIVSDEYVIESGC